VAAIISPYQRMTSGPMCTAMGFMAAKYTIERAALSTMR
jgi:hypothetical protein